MSGTLAELAKKLRELPKTLAAQVTEAAAPALTDLASSTFNAGTDPYGVPWAPSKDGSRVELEDSGALKRFLRYVPIGTRLRVALGVPYAKYQIGKRRVFPRAGAALPAEYTAALTEATNAAIKTSLSE